MIKKSYVTENQVGVPTDEDMSLINGYSLKTLTKDEIFCFSVILCDNDIDRDFERFNEESLKKLESLFVGKTGILNHSMKSEDQTCRTYKTQFLVDNDKRTADGQPYMYLKAWCYTVRSEKNESLIKDIESGIKKEVSVSCASGSRICSICGKPHCSHIQGKTYDGEVCYKTLVDITDAYEWSFVAVPAQRQAGVTKSFKKEKSMENILKSIREEKSLTLNEKDLKKLSDYMDSLKEKSLDGEKYREALVTDAKKNFALALPSIEENCVDDILKNLSSETLEALCTSLEKQAKKILPPVSQLYVEEKTNDTSNNEFKF
ncbi:MAG: hypothetical protein IJZ16_08060 [Clostridia bacterium]|nr:hypothetical protein [Clostridia bacterium]